MVIRVSQFSYGNSLITSREICNYFVLFNVQCSWCTAAIRLYLVSLRTMRPRPGVQVLVPGLITRRGPCPAAATNHDSAELSELSSSTSWHEYLASWTPSSVQLCIAAIRHGFSPQRAASSSSSGSCSGSQPPSLAQGGGFNQNVDTVIILLRRLFIKNNS